MNASNGSGRNRRPRNTYTTKSGKTIKVNRTMADRVKARKNALAADKALYLSTLPKNRLKRILYRLHPKRVAAFWFSREGAIMGLKITGVAIIVGFLLVIGMFAYFRKDLPKIKDIAGSDVGGSITYYDRTGQTVLWQDYGAVKRFPVESDQISEYLKQATVAIEDKDFYKHGAFDVQGITRAAVNNAMGTSGNVQGGSTITQQLVKLNEQWTDNRTITRKVKELILAVELERNYSKKDILTGYLNIAPYGGVQYGAESASRDYFKISAKDLNLAQSSFLAAIPQAPGVYSPYSSSKYNPAVTADNFDAEAVIGRQHYILDQMVKQKYITQKQANEAKKVDILAQVQQAPKNRYEGIKAPYFVLAAKQELERKYGATTVQRGGWKVVTTLNMDLQSKAEELVASNLKNISRFGADQEALVAADVATGQIVSLVGGVDFNNPEYGENNYAAGIKIPPGSSFKPYDYAALLNNNNNVGAGSVLYDTQGVVPGYSCTNKNRPKDGGNCLQNYDFRYPGPITLRYALGGSRNVPAVKAMLQALPNDTSNGRVNSINETIRLASQMMDPNVDGKSKKTYNCYDDEALTIITQCYASSAMGDGAFLRLDDHVNGLATLSRMGNSIPKTYIMSVTDSGGKELYKWQQPKGKQVLKQDAAYIVNDMAADPRASYLPGNCTETNCTNYKFHRYNGWKIGIKTGTTNDGYDGLMTAWSSKYAIVTWVGNHNRNVTLRSSMENLTTPLARGWMQFAHANDKAVNWQAPAGIKTSPAFVVRSHVGIGSQEPSAANDLYPSYYVGNTANKASSSQTLDKVSNKVATSCTPALAKQTSANSNSAFWNIDTFNGGKANMTSGSTSGPTGSTAAAATDDVHNCNDSPPVVSMTASCTTTCTVNAVVTQGTHNLTDPARAEFPGTVNFTVNGQVVHTQRVTDSPSNITFVYAPPAGSTSATMNASVVDSVLYEGTSSITLNYAAPIVGGTGNGSTNGGNGNNNGSGTSGGTGGNP